MDASSNGADGEIRAGMKVVVRANGVLGRCVRVDESGEWCVVQFPNGGAQKFDLGLLSPVAGGDDAERAAALALGDDSDDGDALDAEDEVAKLLKEGLLDELQQELNMKCFCFAKLPDKGETKVQNSFVDSRGVQLA